MIIKPQDFRYCLGHFPKGVTVITTKNSNNEPIGITVDSFNSVSLDPPLILFSINKSSLSHDIFVKSKNFVVNILNEEQETYSKNFASRSTHKWENIRYFESKITKNRVLEESVFYIECRKYAAYPGGDHTILLGELIYIEKVSDKNPLIYYQGKYHKLENNSRKED